MYPLETLMSWVILIKLNATVFITEKRFFGCGFPLRTSQKIQRQDFQIFMSFPKAMVPPNLIGSNLSLILL